MKEALPLPANRQGAAAYVEDYDACLFEFPDVSSTRDFENKGYGEDYVNAICWMLEHYN